MKEKAMSTILSSKQKRNVLFNYSHEEKNKNLRAGLNMGNGYN